jgi:phospholipid/cholesterol/gamma-HCH transport system substrate-binding protein
VASPARLAGVGVFVLSGLLLFAIGLFMIGDRQMAFSKKFTVYTEFSKITGLQPGAIIRVSGAKAGTVKQILPPNRPQDKFKVELEIIEQLHPLVRTDSVATIETEGLVGGSFLGVGTGSEAAPLAPEKSTIPSKEPFQISELLQQMSDTVAKVNVIIDDLKGEVESAVKSIGDTVDNANGLIEAVSDDVKTMASAGARISDDVAEMTEGVRSGKGTIGKLVNDDELYKRATNIAREAEEVASNVKETVAEARKALDSFQDKDGPVQGVTSNLKQTLDGARAAMAGLAENMEALKRNFLFRGFFKTRGYFDLASLSPAEYRKGVLAAGDQRRVVRVWLGAPALFEPRPEGESAEQLTDGGKARLDSAIAPFLEHLADSVMIVEGYAQQGTQDERYLRARARAAMVRDYLIGKFHLDPQATGLMPLGSDSPESPGGKPWDGIALAVIMEKETTARRNAPDKAPDKTPNGASQNPTAERGVERATSGTNP